MKEVLKEMDKLDGFCVEIDNEFDGAAFIQVEGCSLSFQLQDGPVKEVGENGCQVTALIEAAHFIISRFNEKFPCRENAITLTKLDEALMWQSKRTKDREKRSVEGTSKA